LCYLLGVDPWSSLSQQLVIGGDFREAVVIAPITEVVLAIEITTNVAAFFLVISLANCVRFAICISYVSNSCWRIKTCLTGHTFGRARPAGSFQT
jgi:hypothetical protein